MTLTLGEAVPVTHRDRTVTGFVTHVLPDRFILLLPDGVQRHIPRKDNQS